MRNGLISGALNIAQTRSGTLMSVQTITVVGVADKRTFQTVSGEKPTNTTIVFYVSTGGLSMPPLVIFKSIQDQARMA